MIRAKRLSESLSESRLIQGRIDDILENMSSFISDVKNVPAKSESWNRSKYLDRVRTYKSATWFAKPTWMSPTLCSRYGWINFGEDMLQCVGCQSILFGRLPASFDPIVYEACRKRLEQQIRKTAHHACCVWIGNPTPLSIISIDGSGETGTEAVRENFVNRVSGLIKLGSNLPVVDSSSMSICSTDLMSVMEFLEGFHPSVFDASASREILESACLLALCGWEQGNSLSQSSPQVHCEMCSRSSGLWNFVTHDSQSKGETDMDSETPDIFHALSEVSPEKSVVEISVVHEAFNTEVSADNDVQREEVEVELDSGDVINMTLFDSTHQDNNNLDVCTSHVSAENDGCVKHDSDSHDMEVVKEVDRSPKPVEYQQNVTTSRSGIASMATEHLEQSEETVPLTNEIGNAEHLEELVEETDDELTSVPHFHEDTGHTEHLKDSDSLSALTAGDKTGVNSGIIIDTENSTRLTETPSEIQDATTEAVQLLMNMAGGQHSIEASSLKSCITELDHHEPSEESSVMSSENENASKSSIDTSSIISDASESDSSPNDEIASDVGSSREALPKENSDTERASVCASERSLLVNVDEDAFSETSLKEIADEETFNEAADQGMFSESIHEDGVESQISDHLPASQDESSELGLSPITHQCSTTRPEDSPDYEETPSDMEDRLLDVTLGNNAQDTVTCESSAQSSDLDSVVSLKRPSSSLTSAPPPLKRLRAARQRTVFDAVAQHQPWCPWVMVDGQKELQDRPWLRLLKNLSKGYGVRMPETDEMDVSIKALESVRNLFNGWKSPGDTV